jgi:opacity protein-like surface antigen
MRSWLLLLATLALGPRLGAQAFHPPPVQRRDDGTRIGFFGFGIRAGMDLNSGGQAVFGLTLDLGNLASSRLRIRPSGEVGVGNGVNTYVGSLELLFRLTDDAGAVTPYVGAGVGIAGHAECGTDASCPAVWVNGVLGTEIRFRSTFNWLLEYHAMDAFQHNRVYLGLTTRRGN